MSHLQDTIKQVATILDLNLTFSLSFLSPIVYEYTTTTYDEDTLVSTVKQQVIQQGDIFKYMETVIEKDKVNIVEDLNLTTTKAIYDVFQKFVKDSYYDSPIHYNNMERLWEDRTNFQQNYSKISGYFYMGLYRQNVYNTSSLMRVYVKRIKDDSTYGPYNDYKVIT